MIYTPHINANKEDISNIVIMPGDPKRSKFIADNYLENPVLVNDIRGVQGYTGFYKNKKVTVMASGMGNPSMGIYSYELYKYFNTDIIIRVGTAGALNNNINLKDIIVAENILTNTNYHQLNKKGINKLNASNKLLNILHEISNEDNKKYLFGPVYNTDTFYEDEDQNSFINAALAVEMETAALYENAKNFNKDAIAIYTISDHILNDDHLTADDREQNTKEMLDIAFKLIERID